MEPNVFDKVHDVDLKKTMEQSYIDYAMSVISARALPDARDGLKPVQRRVLYSMIELNNGPDKPHRKCARIVGDTMGKYHGESGPGLVYPLYSCGRSWKLWFCRWGWGCGHALYRGTVKPYFYGDAGGYQ